MVLLYDGVVDGGIRVLESELFGGMSLKKETFCFEEGEIVVVKAGRTHIHHRLLMAKGGEGRTFDLR